MDLFVFGVHTKHDDNGCPTRFRIVVRGKTFSFSLINNYAHAFPSGQQRRAAKHVPDICIVFVLSVVCGGFAIMVSFHECAGSFDWFDIANIKKIRRLCGRDRLFVCFKILQSRQRWSGTRVVGDIGETLWNEKSLVFTVASRFASKYSLLLFRPPGTAP